MDIYNANHLIRMQFIIIINAMLLLWLGDERLVMLRKQRWLDVSIILWTKTDIEHYIEYHTSRSKNWYNAQTNHILAAYTFRHWLPRKPWMATTMIYPALSGSMACVIPISLSPTSKAPNDSVLIWTLSLPSAHVVAIIPDRSTSTHNAHVGTEIVSGTAACPSLYRL